MKLLKSGKDGGPKSTVTGYWLVEMKRLLSVVLLRFDDGSRDEYHDHAFGSLSWIVRGRVTEHHLGGLIEEHRPGILPIVTHRDTFHRVVSHGTTWVLSIRGPWSRTWHEYDPDGGEYSTLTHGRVRV